MSKHTETGMGKGNGPHSDKRTYPVEALAELVVERVTTGKPIAKESSAGILTKEDKGILSRFANEQVEVFNERVALQLREIGDLALQKIKEKLEQDQFKPGELGFIYSVAHDKRLSLDGSSALRQASTLVQINLNAPDKAALLAELDGLTR